MPEHVSGTAPGPTSRPGLSVAAVGIGLGVAYLVIGIATDQTGFGIAGLGIMLGYTGLMYGLRRRSEAAGLLAGDVGDERQALIGQRALALSGGVLVAALVLGFLVCLAAQSEYTPVFAGLGALGGVSYLVGVVWFSRRG